MSWDTTSGIIQPKSKPKCNVPSQASHFGLPHDMLGKMVELVPLDDLVSHQLFPSLYLCPLLNSYLRSWPSQEAVVSIPAHGLNLTMPAQLGPASSWGREEVSFLPLANTNPAFWASRPKVCHTTTFLGCPVNPEEVYGCLIGSQHDSHCHLVMQIIAPLTGRGQSILLAKLLV